MKYLLHIALLTSTLAAHNFGQAAVRTQTASRAALRSKPAVTRSTLRAHTRSVAAQNELVELESQDDVPLNVEQLELATRRKRSGALNLDASEVLSERVITRSKAQADRAREGRKLAQQTKDRVHAFAKKAVKSRV